MGYAVDYEKNPKGTNYWRNRVMKVAKEYVPDVRFAVANVHDFAQELTEFGLDGATGGDDKPVVTLRTASGLKYVMSETFSMDSLKAFLDDFKAGKLEPYMKSEAVPDNSAAGVKVAVGKNFQELVTDTENDVPPGFDVKGFPTIFWVKKGDKPVSYNGGREVDDFVNYIAKHATSELKGFDRKGKAKKTEL